MIISNWRRLVFCLKNNLNFIDFCLHNILQRNVSSYQKSYITTCPLVRMNSSRYFCTKYAPYGGLDADFQNEIVPLCQKSTKKEAVQRYISLLGCSEFEALTILKDFPKLKTLPSKEIQNKIQFYNDLGIEIKEIIQNPWMLWFKSTIIVTKIKVLDAMGIKDIRSAVPLLGVTLKRLKEIECWSESNVTYNEKSRIAYLSEKLECDPAEVCHAISPHKFIFRMPFDRLAGVIDLLLDAGVCPEHILRDIWVLRYNKAQVSDRISRAKEGGIIQFKPWMVRSTEKTFNNTLRRHSEKRVLLGPHKDSAIQYISSRLGVSHSEAMLILTRHPQLRGVGAAKLCNTLDFLLGKENGTSDADALERTLSERSQLENSAKFDRVQVWTSIRALCHSLETMKDRLSRLRALGYEPYSPSVLYKSRRKFEEFIKRLEEKAAAQAQLDDTAAKVDKENGSEGRSGATG